MEASQKPLVSRAAKRKRQWGKSAPGRQTVPTAWDLCSAEGVTYTGTPQGLQIRYSSGNPPNLLKGSEMIRKASQNSLNLPLDLPLDCHRSDATTSSPLESLGLAPVTLERPKVTTKFCVSGVLTHWHCKIDFAMPWNNNGFVCKNKGTNIVSSTCISACHEQASGFPLQNNWLLLCTNALSNYLPSDWPQPAASKQNKEIRLQLCHQRQAGQHLKITGNLQNHASTQPPDCEIKAPTSDHQPPTHFRITLSQGWHSEASAKLHASKRLDEFPCK